MDKKMNGYKDLMTAVLAQTMTDYIHAVKVGGVDFSKELEKEHTKVNKEKKKNRDLKKLRKIQVMTRGEKAKHYIFDNSEELENYVFGFKFICTYLGLDPEKFRKKIKEKREDFWENIYKW